VAGEVGEGQVVEKLGCWSKKVEFLKQGETWKDFKPRILPCSFETYSQLFLEPTDGAFYSVLKTER